MSTSILSTTTPSKPETTTTTQSASSEISANTVIEAAKLRRSIYQLGKDLPIPKERVRQIVEEALLHTPSSFNSQSNRVLVLFGAEHDALWDIVTDVLRAIVPAESWEPTGQKMAMFKGAAGTVLVFEDQNVVNGMQERFPNYSDRFPPWAVQSAGMLEYVLWTALAAEGVGANLQHYNPLIDERVAAKWKVPSSWKLNAQLVFGAKVGGPNPKDFKPLEERMLVYGL